MNHPDYNSPSALKAFLDENGMAMQKKFGQNFMVNPAARKDIVNQLELVEGSKVWEVGPGLGCMTEEILQHGAELTCFEIDRGFIKMLHSFFEDYEQKGCFRIVEGDVLKTWHKNVENSSEGETRSEVSLFGNLPYNIAATFIADTITKGFVFKKCVFTVQKEVTERICALPSSENYSGFTVLCHYYYDVKKGIELAAGNFWPRPNVASQAVVLTPKEKMPECVDQKLFVKLVHALFSSRRKTVANNIKPMLNSGMNSDDIFQKAGISKSERAENLSLEKFVELTNVLASAYEANRNGGK